MSGLFGGGRGGKAALVKQALGAREQDPLTPPLMPDEETLRKTRRRTFQRKRRTGRESTKLTDQLG